MFCVLRADIRIEGSGVTTNPGSLFTEQPTTTFSRRSMLNNGVLEEDSVSDISGAGNSMNCENDIVQQVQLPNLPACYNASF